MNLLELKKAYVILNKLKKDLSKKSPVFNYPYICYPNEIVGIDFDSYKAQYSLKNLDRIMNFVELYKRDLDDLILAIMSIYIKNGCKWLALSNKKFIDKVKDEFTHHINLIVINKELKELEEIFNARDVMDDFTDDVTCNIFVTDEKQENGLLNLVKEGKYSYISFCKCLELGAFKINPKLVKDKALKVVLDIYKSINQLKIKS